jgi:arylsulfatase
MDTPFQWSKQIASHFGGTRNGLVISWPGHMADTSTVRAQFHHVIDIAPTIYDAAGIKPPVIVDGVRQTPLQGVSMLYTLQHPQAPSSHHSQYFEMQGNRAFYADGWIASSTPLNMPWVHSGAVVSPDHFRWELYDLHHDYSQAHDLSNRMPAKLAELRKDFDLAAAQFNVLPLNADALGRLNPELRPSLTAGREQFVYHPSPTRFSNAELPSLGRNWRLFADIRVEKADAMGTVAVRGNWFGGWGLFLDHGVPVFIYRASDQTRDLHQVSGLQPLGAGDHRLTVDVRGNPRAQDGEVVLSMDGMTAGRVSIDRLGRAGGSLYVGRSGTVPLLDGGQFQGDLEGRVMSVEFDVQPRSAP